MPKSNKFIKTPSRLALFSHAGNLEKQHVVNYFESDSSLDAAYIITVGNTTNPDLPLHYINRIDKDNIYSFPIDGEVDNLVKELECVKEYERFKKNKAAHACLHATIKDKHLKILLNKSKQIHRSYSTELALALEKFDKINDFSLRDEELYLNAMKAYQVFIQNYIKEMLTALDIHPGRDFYDNERFTTAKLDNQASIISLPKRLATFLN